MAASSVSAPELNATESHERAWQQRQAQIAAERAAWPEQYATVREALALGFLPHAYYWAEGPDNPEHRAQRPPTKFGYPPGGLAYPAHAGGPSHGARFQVWSHQHDTPDALRDRPVWEAGDPSFFLHSGHYRTRARLTLAEAFRYCIACGDHARQHFIVPEWTADNDLVLPAGHWRELLALQDGSCADAPRQLDLFGAAPVAEPQTHRDVAFQVIASLPLGAPDDARYAWRATAVCYVIERIIDEANRRRIAAGVPALTTESVVATSKRLADVA